MRFTIVNFKRFVLISNKSKQYWLNYIESRLFAVHYPQNSSTVLLRSRCCLVGMCIVLALVLVNSLPLVELSLSTRITLSAASADGSDGPDGMSNSTKGSMIALEHAGAGTTFQVFAESIPPIYKDGAIDEYANEHTVHRKL